ncbi:MAG: PPC domain-containing protein [Acidobacteriota bacterium]
MSPGLIRAVLVLSCQLALTASTLTAQRFGVFPQVAVGGGWSFDVFVNNQATDPAPELEIRFFNDAGDPLQLDTNLGSSDRFSFSLEPGATQVINASRNSEAQAGYGVLQAPDNSSIRATLVLRFEQGGQVTTAVGVAQQLPFINYSFAAEVDSARRVNTGLALANPLFDLLEPSNQQFVVSLISEDGGLRNTEVISLAPGEHTSLFLDDPRLFPGLDSFKGTVTVSGPLAYGLLALRLDQSILTSVAINNGPVVSPFLPAVAVTAEEEPNDTSSSAQALTLPALVEGKVSVSNDVDSFSFSLHQGDIFTIVVEADSLGSELDSFLVLEGPQGDTVSVNDQSGLLGLNDSFIQLAVPADGIYIVHLDDFFFGGGQDYDYRLHLGLGQTGPPVLIPALTSISPGSANRGSTVEVVLEGQNLEGGTALDFDPPDGITVANLKFTDSRVTASVTVSETAPLGSRAVSATTPLGTSNTLDFTITEAGAGGSLDGSWAGMTEQGKEISFEVASNGVMSLSFKGTVQGSGCTAQVETVTDFSQGPKPIVNNAFSFSVTAGPGAVSFSISGTFTSPTTASGQITMTLNSLPGVPICSGTTETDWSASKQ